MVFERVPIIRLNRCELMQFNNNHCMPKRDDSPPPKSRKTILNKSTIQPQPLIFDHEVMSRTNYQHNQNNHDRRPQTLNTTSQLTPKMDKKQNQQSKPPALKFTHALLTYQNVSEPNISETLAFHHKDIIKQTRSDSISRQDDNTLNLQDSMFANNISSRSPNNELATLNFGEGNIKQTTKMTKKTNVLNQQNTMFVNDITLSQQLDHHQQKRNTLNDIDEEKTKQIKQLSNIQLNLHSYKNIGHSLKEISRPQSVGENESCNNYLNTLPIGIKGSQQRQRNLSGEVNNINIIHGQKKIETLNDPQQSKQENLDLVKTIAKHKAPPIVITQPIFNRLEDIEENKGLAKDRICYQNTSMADKIEPEKEIRLVSVSCDLLNKMNTVKSYNGIDDLVAPLDNDADDEGSLRNNSSSLVVDHGYNTSSSKENLSDIDEPETLFVESDRRSKNGNLSDFADTDDSCIKENLNERRLSDEDNLGERELVNFEIEGQYHHKYLLLIDNSGDLNNDHLTEIEEEVDSSDEEEQDCSYHSYYYSTDRRSSSPAVLTKSRHTRRNYLSEIKEVTSDEESEFCCPKDTLSYHRRSSLPAILDSGSTDDSNKDTFNKTKSSFTICSNREIFRNIKEETPNSVNLVSPSNRRRRTSPLATPRRSSIPSNLTPCEYSESMDRRQIRNYIQQTSNDIARLCDKSDSEDETNYIKKELSLKPKKSEYEPSHTRRKISRVNSLSFSPFNLRNKNTTLEKPRATLTSDLTISGRNPMLETNNYANIESVKLRSWSVDSFVKNDFKFRIERRKVISFEGLQPKTSKETISSPCEESKESNMRKNVSPLPRESDFDQHCTVNLLNQTMNSNDNVKSISSDVVERQDDVKTCNIREESIKCRKSPELDINLNIDVQKDIQPKHRQNHTDLAQRFLHLTETSPEGSELRTQNKTRRMSSDTATHQRRQMENQFQPSSVLAERLLESYRALGKHSHMYLGIASAKKCRAKRRRHSMDHIGSYRRRFRMIEELNDQGTQGDTESITTNSDNESNNGYGGHEQYSEYTTTHTTTKKKNSFKLSMPNIQCPQDTSEAIRQRPALNRTKSEDSQTSGIDMRISEQDLGSDAESLPSCEESLTNSENSPPNSPELFKQKQEVSRRESAPASFNIKILDDIQGLNEINEERSREFHRRYSSVEERTSRVRFNLEESFKEEEDHYSKQFDENEEQPKFSDIEGYKVAPLTQYPRKVSSPPCLSCDIEEVRQEYQQNQQVPTAQRKDSSDRSRKCSVYSDNSGSIQILPGQSVRKVSSQENLIREEEESTPIAPLRNKYDRKISLQEPKLRKDSRVDNRKLSLQENSSRRKSVCIDEKSTNENSRKFSLQIPRRRPSFSDRKLSLQERKNSTHERKMSSHDRKYSAHERKISSSERKYSAHERKLSQQETRKTSLTDTFRSVVGTKKKSERKASQEVLADENNNVDRKSAWGLIKNKIKKDRKSSAEAIQQGSPRMLRLLSRNDSSSSIDSGTPRRHRRSGSAGKRASTRSEDYDQKSISSFNSVDLEDEPDIVPPNAFDLWSEGKVDIETESSTLPLLHVAAGEGNAELLKTLLDVGVDMNELDQCGWPALHYAVCAGHFECAQLLLSRGATLKNYSNRVMNTYCTAVRDCIRTGSPYSST